MPPEEYNRYCDSLSMVSEDDSWDDNEEFENNDDYYDEEEAGDHSNDEGGKPVYVYNIKGEVIDVKDPPEPVRRKTSVHLLVKKCITEESDDDKRP